MDYTNAYTYIDINVNNTILEILIFQIKGHFLLHIHVQIFIHSQVNL